MYIAVGKEKWIRTEDIIAFFDLDITSQSYLTRKFLAKAEKNGEVRNTAEDIPKSYVICRESGKNVVYLCQMATATLAKRIME